MSRVFIDTNVLIYARDRRSDEKRRLARAWLSALTDRGLAVVNLQVLNELTRWILANETKRPITDVKDEIGALRSWGDKRPDDDEIEMAWQIRARLGYSWFDCLLLAAAVQDACAYFLTEDMGDRARFGPITLINPFSISPDAILPSH